MTSSDMPAVLVTTALGTRGRCIRDRLVEAAVLARTSAAARVGAR